MVELTIPTDHKVKVNGSEKRDEYCDLANELKKLWNLKTTIMPNIIGVLGTIPKV